MQQEFSCQQKDKRLLVLFALGILILFSDVEIFAQHGVQQKQHSWIMLQPEEKVYRADTHQDIFLKNISEQIAIAVDEKSLADHIKPGRIYTFFQDSDDSVEPGTSSPRLAFFLGHQLSVNSADTEDLILIHGVGPALASKIIDYRDKYGKISNANQLVQIPGIGQKTKKKLEKYLTF